MSAHPVFRVLDGRPVLDDAAAIPRAWDLGPAAPVSAGAPGVAISFHGPSPGNPLPCYLYVPEIICADRRPLVAVHGISRNARAHAQAFAPLAARSGRVVVAPLFDEPHFRRYQKVMMDEPRADHALLAMLEHMRGRVRLATGPVDLFGFSGGSQFAHRFAMLHPERVACLVLAAAGWYTFPSEEDRFPYGMAPASAPGRDIAASLDRFLQIPTLVLVGEADTARDAGLRQGRRVDPRQGRTRVERAKRWTEAIRKAALTRGLPAQIVLQMLPGCGHNFTQCVARGALAERVVTWFDSEA